MLFNQFHDILAGTSIRAACDETVRQNRLVIDECRQVSEDSARAVAARVNAPAPGQTLVVFNPLGWRREEVVSAEVNWRESAPALTVETLDGEPVPHQMRGSTWSGGGRSASLLVNPIIPPCGYRALRVKPREEAETGEETPPDPTQISNGVLQVKLGAGTEWIREITAAEGGFGAVRPGCGCGVVLDDPSDTWSHGVDRFRDEIGRFEMVGEPVVLASGPLRWTVRATGRWGYSWLIQEISLDRGRRQVDVTAEIRWHERRRMGKLSIPTRVLAGEATFEIPYGAIVRPQTGDEEPGQRWVDLSGVLGEGPGEGTR